MFLTAARISCILLSSVLDPRSEQAARGYDLLIYFFIAASFILLVVSTLTILFLYRYKAQTGDKEPPQIKNNRKVELVMITIPLLMVTFFFYLTVKASADILPEHENQVPEVVITAHQWWWQANYPASGVVTANEIHVPVGKKILLKFLSSDVIHSWWLPQLGNKMDIIPGRENYIWMTIKEPGYYEGACSEFCGKEHAWMRINLYAERMDDYQAWLAAESRPANEVAESKAAMGKNIFMSKTCSNCHAVKGTEANSTIGPDLTHLANRKTLLTGLLNNNEESLAQWLKDPQNLKPGAYMPDFHLNTTEQEALVAYLMQLK